MFRKKPLVMVTALALGLGLVPTAAAHAAPVSKAPVVSGNFADGFKMISDNSTPPPPPTPDEIDKIKKRLEEAARSGEATAANTNRSARTRRSVSTNPQPMAVPSPNPALDFETIKPDPENYRLPEAAYKWKTGTPGKWADGDKINIPTTPTAGGTALGKFDPALEKFYAQKVEWGSCKPFGYEITDRKTGAVIPEKNARIECGYAIVPMDYKNPNGPTIAIAMLKVKSKAVKPLGTVFTDPGGPGGSGMDSAKGMVDDPITEKFDLIGFDPRGVGDSLPQIRCESSDATDKQRQFTDDVTGPQQDEIDKYNVEQCKKNTTKIYNGLDGFLPTVGTVNVVNDLDILRSVVGDKKLSYLGFSYGTKIGYRYAQDKKENIGALVLDGVVNPYQNNKELLKKYTELKILVSDKESSVVSQSRGFGDTFKQFVKACVEGKIQGVGFFRKHPNPTGCALRDGGPIANPSQAVLDAAYDEYLKLARKAWNTEGYPETPDGRQVSFSDFTQGTILAMYSEGYWQYLRDSLALAKNKNAFGMMILSDAYAGRDDAGKYSFEQAAFQTISCMDRPKPDGTASDDKETVEEIFKVAKFRDPGIDPNTKKQRGIVATVDTCHFYDDHDVFPKGEELQGIPNVLVLSSSYDPATPYGNGVVAAMGLHGTLLSVANASHCAYGKYDCSTNITLEYLENPAQFLKNIKAGKYAKDKKYTGPTPVDTRHIFSDKDVQGNTCQLDYYGPEATVEENGKAANEVLQYFNHATIKATKLIPNEKVTFRLKNGKVLGEATADKHGNAEFSLRGIDDLTGGKQEIEMVQQLNVYPVDLNVKATPITAWYGDDTAKQELTVHPGDKVTVNAKYFVPEKDVVFTVHSKPVEVGKVTAGKEYGEVSLTFDVPKEVEVGAHTVELAQGEFKVSLKLNVVAVAKKSDSELPNTGVTSDLPAGAGLALLLLAAGGALIASRRK